MSIAILALVLSFPATAFEPALNQALGQARQHRVDHREVELAACKNAETVSSEPEAPMYTFVGFRLVRSDDTTCSDQPSDKIYYQERDSDSLRFAAGPGEDPSKFTYALETGEFVIRRNYYLRGGFGGGRSFYSYDRSHYTGKKIPETAALEFVNRSDFPLLPWEPVEEFVLSYGDLAGASLTPRASSYEYEIRKDVSRPGGQLLTQFTARSLRKKQLTAPVWKAVSLRLAGGAGPTLAVVVNDSLAKYYKGEKIAVMINVYRDGTLGDKHSSQSEMIFDAGEEIRLDPRDPKWNPTIHETLKSGYGYDAIWKFRRVNSRVSTGDWSPEVRSEKVKLP